MADTYWAEREGARWDVYGKQRGWMAQADTEDDARLIVAALTALQAQQPAAAVPEGYALAQKWREQANAALRRSGTWNGGDMADRIERMADELEAMLAAAERKGE